MKTFLEDKQGYSKSSEFLSWLLGMVIAYLGKQVYSSKQDGKRDQRIALIEKLLNKDLDGYGIIGPASGPDAVRA